MKYISLVITLVLMAWTWSLATAQPSFSMEQTQAVQDGVENDIKAFIVRKYPLTTDIYCQQLYTEAVKPGEQMNVHFRCSTRGGASNYEKVSQIFEGYLKLASKDGFQSWDETGGEIRSPEVVFENGSIINTKLKPANEPTDAPEGANDTEVVAPEHAE